MNLNNRLPKFTAQASLYYPKNEMSGLTHNGGAASFLTTKENIRPAQLCPPCEPCDPVTNKKQCYIWRPAQKECATVTRSCSSGGPGAPNCPCPPGWSTRWSAFPLRCYCTRS